MRPVFCGLAAGVMACQALTAHAQQGSVQISAAAQGLTGAPLRTAGENAVDPDFGISWLQPGVRFGTFQIELRGTRRADRLHVGRNYAALRDLKHGGLAWTFEAGDSYFSRAIGEYGFSNVTAPAVTFSGGAISGRSARGRVDVIGGRTTAWRNIFGSDPDTLGQTLGIVGGSIHLTERFDVLGRATRVQTSSLREFAFAIADSRQVGGGVRVRLTSAVQLVGDASILRYRRLDSSRQQNDTSFLIGTHVHLARGWLQLNASRFSPGDFPVMNDPLHDRESVFGAGEYDLIPRARVFAGWETIRSNIDPDASLSSSRTLPRNLASRGFGGVRLQLGARTTLTLRAEEGDRISRPALGGIDRESDTGLRGVEWQSAVGPITAYLRISRRDNVDLTSSEATYTQDDLSAQLFMRVSRSTQVFGLGALTRYKTGIETGSTYWLVGGGAQTQLWERNLWFRAEGTTSRNVDFVTRDFIPQESFNVGLNGQFNRATTIGFNITADRTPLVVGSGTPWTTRSIVRIVQAFSTGAARVPAGTAGAAVGATRARGTGTVLGSVFTDWNANGVQDPGEEPLENISVRIAAVSSVTTSRGGEFSFLNVPAGPQTVGLDAAAIPVDFDPPAEPLVPLELDRNTTRRVSFGLIPLGSVRGRVVHDANGNGRVDPGEAPLEGAVLVLDGGARSEQVRRGVFRFESVRSGDHVISLLGESLPEGAIVSGATNVAVALNRDQMSLEIDFPVRIEKRPETRRVFPPRGGSPQSSRAPGPSTAVQARSQATASARPGARDAAVQPNAAARARSQPGASGTRPPVPDDSAHPFVVQVAALSDPVRAREMVSNLIKKGYPAYLVEPAATDPAAPHPVRVGRFATRLAAAAASRKLERTQGERLWVIREAAGAPATVK